MVCICHLLDCIKMVIYCLSIIFFLYPVSRNIWQNYIYILNTNASTLVNVKLKIYLEIVFEFYQLNSKVNTLVNVLTLL